MTHFEITISDKNVPATKYNLLVSYIAFLENKKVSKSIMNNLKAILPIVKNTCGQREYDSVYYDPCLGLYVFNKNGEDVEYIKEQYYILHKRDYQNMYNCELIKQNKFICCKTKEQPHYLLKHGYVPISKHIKDNCDQKFLAEFTSQIFKSIQHTKVSIYQKFNELYYIHFLKLSSDDRYRLCISIQHKILVLFSRVIYHNPKITNIEFNTQLKKIVKEQFDFFIKKFKDNGKIYDKPLCDLSKLDNVNQGHCPFDYHLSFFCNGQQYIIFDNYVIYLCYFKFERDLAINSYIFLNLVAYCWLEEKQHCIIIEVFTGNVYAYDPDVEQFYETFDNVLLGVPNNNFYKMLCCLSDKNNESDESNSSDEKFSILLDELTE